MIDYTHGTLTLKDLNDLVNVMDAAYVPTKLKAYVVIKGRFYEMNAEDALEYLSTHDENGDEIKKTL